MRIHVGKARDGFIDILIDPGRGTPLSPSLIRGQGRDEVLAKVREEVDRIKGTQPRLPGLEGPE